MCCNPVPGLNAESGSGPGNATGVQIFKKSFQASGEAFRPPVKVCTHHHMKFKIFSNFLLFYGKFSAYDPQH
jgi:hypothetical protein